MTLHFDHQLFATVFVFRLLVWIDTATAVYEVVVSEVEYRSKSSHRRLDYIIFLKWFGSELQLFLLSFPRCSWCGAVRTVRVVWIGLFPCFLSAGFLLSSRHRWFLFGVLIFLLRWAEVVGRCFKGWFWYADGLCLLNPLIAHISEGALDALSKSGSSVS